MTKIYLAPLDDDYQLPVEHNVDHETRILRLELGDILAANDGSQDIGPLIQAAYDAGARTITLAVPGGSYALDTPVFLDSTNNGTDTRVLINLNGSTLVLGPSLPSTNKFFPDTNRIWAIWPNTKRSALGAVTAGVVEMTTTYQANGAAEIPNMVTFVNGVVNGQKQNRGFCYGNNANALFYGVKGTGLMTMTTWRNYVDQGGAWGCAWEGILTQAEFTALGVPAGAEQAFVHQIEFGDGAYYHVEGHGRSYTAIIRNAQGAVIDGNVGGNLWIRDSKVSIRSNHIEGDQFAEGTRPGPPILVDCGDVTIQNCDLWTSHLAGDIATVIVKDTANEGYTDLVIRDTAFVCRFRNPTSGSGQYDDGTESCPDIYISAANSSTRIRCENVYGELQTASSASRYRLGVRVASAITGLQAVLDTAAAQSVIATGSFEIRRKGSSTWEVVPLASRGFTPVRKVVTPAFPDISATVDLGSGPVHGTLSNGVPYEYTFAMLDALGNYGTRLTVPAADVNGDGIADNICTPTSGALGILLNNQSGSPGLLVAWRKQSSDASVLTGATAYCIIPVDGQHIALFDTGAHLNKRPWITSAMTTVPAPNTVAVADHSTEALLLPSGARLWTPLMKYKAADTSRTSTASRTADPDLASMPLTIDAIDSLAFWEYELFLRYLIPGPTSGALLSLSMSLSGGLSTGEFHDWMVLSPDGMAATPVTTAWQGAYDALGVGDAGNISVGGFQGNSSKGIAVVKGRCIINKNHSLSLAWGPTASVGGATVLAQRSTMRATRVA